MALVVALIVALVVVAEGIDDIQYRIEVLLCRCCNGELVESFDIAQFRNERNLYRCRERLPLPGAIILSLAFVFRGTQLQAAPGGNLVEKKGTEFSIKQNRETSGEIVILSRLRLGRGEIVWAVL